jgi:hypothetical protein
MIRICKLVSCICIARQAVTFGRLRPPQRGLPIRADKCKRLLDRLLAARTKQAPVEQAMLVTALTITPVTGRQTTFLHVRPHRGATARNAGHDLLERAAGVQFDANLSRLPGRPYAQETVACFLRPFQG